MLTYEQILELIDKLVETPLSEISLAQGEFSISLKKESSQSNEISNINTALVGGNYSIPAPVQIPPPQQTEAPAQNNFIDVLSPMVGTFYAAPSPDAAPYVQIGQQVKNGDVLCIIEAMKMMNEFPSEVNGSIAEVCAKNGETVEFGQVLFKIKPN